MPPRLPLLAASATTPSLRRSSSSSRERRHRRLVSPSILSLPTVSPPHTLRTDAPFSSPFHLNLPQFVTEAKVKVGRPPYLALLGPPPVVALIQFAMTEMMTELDMAEADITEKSSKLTGTCIVAGDEGFRNPESRRKKAIKNAGTATASEPDGNQSMTEARVRPADANSQELSSGSIEKNIEEPVANQSVTEARVQPASDNSQELSSDSIEKNTEGLLEDELDIQTNSVEHTPQQAEEQNQLHGNMQIIEMPSNNISSESDSDSSSGSDSDSELGKYFYPKIEELENARQPEPGMKFQTLEDAHGFYNTYALLTGFAVKRGTNYMRKKFHLVCNRSGKPKPTRLNRKRKRSSIEKTNCQAKVIVKLTRGQWEFTTVRNEHNHPLCPSASLTKFFLSHKDISTEEKSLLKVLQKSRIPPNKVMKIFRRMRDIPLKKKDMTGLQYAEHRRTENSDVEVTLKHLKELELRNPCFLYTKQTDEDNIARSIFWSDARSKLDYEIFGDFLLFDTTYTTFRHNMPFTPIIGINNHGRTLLLGCALLHDEKSETFIWMFQKLLQMMGGKMPVSIITNQDEAMAKAIAEVMPQVRHRFCKSDVMGKAQEKISAFMAVRGNIKEELDSLVDNSLTETEFEEGWISLIKRYDASENEYLRIMWKTRKNWVPVYFRQDFFPFVESHGRGERMNLLFKDYVLTNDRIEKFIERYEEIQKEIIETDDEDRLQTGTVPSCFSLHPIEKHAANIYTRQIFLKVQREVLNSTAFNVHEVQRGVVYRLDKVFNYENPEFDRNYFEVIVEPGTNSFTCQCAKFTRDGILCCHIIRLFTQFGINEIPEQYILPRWTDKFREEKAKQYKEKCLRKTENTMRYAKFMSKMADLGKRICGDGARYNAAMLEVDKIEKMSTAEGENPEFDELDSMCCGQGPRQQKHWHDCRAAEAMSDMCGNQDVQVQVGAHVQDEG
ncbi:protein FAR1-RELATED SEQUENCE 5 isoform X2 [Brachypodium distachyon]|uniref:protein FAR1-RELATED SEQUENCE 5 isoform X2 n=1 Tax=Brachypodium distachyon TaxID=15368 RepID=UPI00071DEB4C|nr:protein FAR1-RELATED SEQUENCE 5 isoform X2 [Brachypodium distachyon]|eukprot:XP_014755403.1 protein FAR1-RELATED SEQUENCE 5 isoform X2 [Brachypodium distachyon]